MQERDEMLKERDAVIKEKDRYLDKLSSKVTAYASSSQVCFIKGAVAGLLSAMTLFWLIYTPI